MAVKSVWLGTLPRPSGHLYLPVTVLAAAITLSVAVAPAAARKLPTTVMRESSVDLPKIGSSGLPKEQEQDLQSSAHASPGEPVASRPPQITFIDGQLTIVAENASLAEVMKGLQSVLGAEIELPPIAANQRIWTHLGPGPARRVIRDLLDGTEFNYIIQSSDDDTDGVRLVSLTVRSKAGATGTPGTPETATNLRKARPGSSGETPDTENPSSPDVAAVDATAPTMHQQPESVNQQSVAGNPGVGSSGSGTPANEQMIQQLQSMYQLRKQMQMQQNQKSASPAPAPSSNQ